jgi:hypothetical protein
MIDFKFNDGAITIHNINKYHVEFINNNLIIKPLNEILSIVNDNNNNNYQDFINNDFTNSKIIKFKIYDNNNEIKINNLKWNPFARQLTGDPLINVNADKAFKIIMKFIKDNNYKVDIHIQLGKEKSKGKPNGGGDDIYYKN